MSGHFRRFAPASLSSSVKQRTKASLSLAFKLVGVGAGSAGQGPLGAAGSAYAVESFTLPVT